MTGHDRTGQDRTGQDRTGQDRTGHDRKEEMTVQNRTEKAQFRAWDEVAKKHVKYSLKTSVQPFLVRSIIRIRILSSVGFSSLLF
jgi:hypothetical protein